MLVSFFSRVTLTSRCSGTRVDADDLSLIGVIAGFDEELATIGQLGNDRERRHRPERSETREPVWRARISPAHGR